MKLTTWWGQHGKVNAMMNGCEACGAPRMMNQRACRSCLDTFRAWRKITGNTFGIWLKSVQHKFSNVQNSGGLLQIPIFRLTRCSCGTDAYGVSCETCALNSGTCEACGKDERKWNHRICETCYDNWVVVQKKPGIQSFRQFLADRGRLTAESDTATGAAKCECGSDAVGGGTHSRWCPKGGGR